MNKYKAGDRVMIPAEVQDKYEHLPMGHGDTVILAKISGNTFMLNVYASDLDSWNPPILKKDLVDAYHKLQKAMQDISETKEVPTGTYVWELAKKVEAKLTKLKEMVKGQKEANLKDLSSADVYSLWLELHAAIEGQ